MNSSHEFSTPRRAPLFSTDLTKRAACFVFLFTLALASAPRARTARAQSSPTPAPQQGASGVATLDPSTRNTRRVATGSIKGRIVGEGGEPLAGLTVYAAPRTFGAGQRAPHTATADEEGNFTLGGLEPGLYVVGASLPGLVPEIDPSTGRAGTLYRPGDTATVRLVRGGVVTGTVADSRGEPLVAMSVRAYRVRDLDGRAAPPNASYASEDKTDDRGVYRIYGLLPGIYVVLAGGFSPWAFGPGAGYDTDVPVFYPSATRDTASEVAVRAGQDTTGIDIRYRDEQGHRITGVVELPAAATDANTSFGVTLYYAASSINAGNTWVSPGATTERPFSLEGIADGDYDLQAAGGSREGQTVSSAPQRITVRGADVTGLRIKLAPLASIAGTLTIEQATGAQRALLACKDRRASLLPQETLITATADRPSAKNQPAARISPARDASPDDAGAFTLRSLEAGRYRLSARPLDENLYVSSLQLPAATAPTSATATTTPARGADATQRANAAASRDTLEVRPGQQLTGVAVSLSEGAAGLSGRVGGAEGAPSPPYASLRVYLLPAERERTDDLLRYFETQTDADGTFLFKNLPPGRYLLLARTVDVNDSTPRPASWDADSRARLRREAEASNTSVELQPCQRTADFNLRFPPTPK